MDAVRMLRLKADDPSLLRWAKDTLLNAAALLEAMDDENKAYKHRVFALQFTAAPGRGPHDEEAH